MASEISRELETALGQIRQRIKWAQGQPWFNFNDPIHAEDMKPLFPRMAKWFPQINHGTAEERSEFRHCLLMALTGQPIGSQYDLCVGIHIILKKEVFSDNSAYLTRSVADELAEAIQGRYSLEPWTIPASIPTIAGLRSVR